ncbi:MAG TPA: penicillin-binding protein 2 [Myxococcota bacterium]|nr:penicillin-binding protein 2 [Myxococcota bacterium]HQP95046.1 penicillin-binding protein 2 [Myxococcota bacterium]
MIGLQDGLVEYRTHFRWAVILVATLFSALVVRLFYLQIVRGELYESLAAVSHVETERIIPPRGSIYDRNGVLLATDVEVSDLMVIPQHVKNPQASVEQLMNLGVLNAAEAADALEKISEGKQGLRRFQRIPVKRNLVGSRCPYDLEPLRFDAVSGRMICSVCGRSFLDEKAVMQAHLHEMRGFSLSSRMVRYYPVGASAIHAVGYVNEVGGEEVAESDGKFKPGDVIGRAGLEKALDAELRGEVGEDVFVRSADGSRLEPADLPEPFRKYESHPPVPGRGVKSTLDIELQKVAVQALKPYKSGAVVVLDIETGEILAMASQPTFELGPRLTAVASRREEPAAGEYAPMMNKAVSAFPPGSTFKVFTAFAGLMEDVVDRRTKVDCPGFYEYRNRKFRCFVRSGHGELDLVESIAKSCDVYFYRLGDLLGLDVIARYAHDMFGIGEKTGVEISEMSGLMPTEKWYENRKTGYQPGFAVNASVGQGDIRTTPLAMARAYAAVFNGGRVLKPRMVLSWIDPASHQETPALTEVVRRLNLDPADVELVSRGLWGAVNEEGGTAYASRIEELPYMGKTGTAEARESRKGVSPEISEWLKEDHAWFVAVAPARRPRIAVVSFVEHAGFGGEVAAPIARRVIEAYYRSHADEFVDLWEGFDSRPVLEIVPEIVHDETPEPAAPDSDQSQATVGDARSIVTGEVPVEEMSVVGEGE